MLLTGATLAAADDAAEQRAVNWRGLANVWHLSRYKEHYVVSYTRNLRT